MDRIYGPISPQFDLPKTATLETSVIKISFSEYLVYLSERLCVSAWDDKVRSASWAKLAVLRQYKPSYFSIRQNKSLEHKVKVCPV